MKRMLLPLLVTLFAAAPAHGETEILCTAVADVTVGKTILKQEGDCEHRVTPASTFKIAISLMGYETGFLKDLHTPALPFRKGDPDWVIAWRRTTDPAHWMEKSVLWYSQRVTEFLGEERFKLYVRAFHYGNRDVTGDPGKNNGLTWSWLSSSLKISPLEQLEFLRYLVKRRHAVGDHAFDMTEKLTSIGMRGNGWRVNGKTGAAYLKKADGSLNRQEFYGWFVGWARKGERKVVFARLTKERGRQPGSPGRRARDAVLQELFAGPDAFLR